MNDVSLVGSTMYIQDAVYWAPSDLDGNAATTFQQPVPVRVRWKDENAMFIDRAGNQMVSRARVRVDPAVTILELGVLWLGLIDDLVDDEGSPFQNDGAYEIRKVQSIPSRRGTKRVQIAIL